MGNKISCLLILFLLVQFGCKKERISNDICDCSNSQSKFIIDTLMITIPNLFTPNGDGMNDQWIIINFDKFPNSSVKVKRTGIFGGTVYESTGTMQWNGQHNGKLLKDGKYKYEATINGNTYTGYVCIYTGSVKPDNDCIESCSVLDQGDPLTQ